MENKKTEHDNATKVCRHNIRAIHDTMDVIGGKWKISIISCLCFETMRYSELLKEIEGISGKMLSRELKDLEINGLVMRTVSNTNPISVVYELTEYGETLKDLTLTIANWGNAHREKIISEYN
ncbi:helix-turn-helix domain-containing protein [Chishuiella changwenlii]|jgi:DNA-binding HxlR family transcriptional regulator|uniref:winged helix-turn-helix transcriptional regulator n=1 Tax=Chishuiella changwenlii TaxID=1434701 RepID=UPI002FDB322A